MSPDCSQCGFNNRDKAKFCIKCGNSLSEILLEIKETLIKSIVFSIGCMFFFIFLMIIVNIAIFVEAGTLQGFVGIVIIWPLTFFLILWIKYYLRGGTKERKFTISKDDIKIQIPNRESFRISWSDFKSIEIVRRTIWNAVSDTQTRFYNLIFKGDDRIKSFEIESGREFSRKALKKIRMNLEEISNTKGIDYVFFKKPPK
ncbi:MAG: zinc ribbon domain-containing protein [Promethearchaeota archaeon]